MLFKETVAVYCENHTEHIDTLCVQNAVYIFSSYLTGNTSPHHYKTQPVNAVKETVAVYSENHTEHCVGGMQFWYVKADGTYCNLWALKT
jgi:hypothetical protein